METSTDLGFLEKRESWLLRNKFFPSKVGGCPAWLDLEKIPSHNLLKCDECNNELAFLCQVYAPLDDFEHCFHRMIYVFICLNSTCWKPNTARNIKALRCQLPRQNIFYDFEPPNEEAPSEAITGSVHLCAVCGCRGPLSCGQCKSAHYCGASHQKIDWTLGEHKKSCGTKSTNSIGNVNHGYLLEEFELVTEPERMPVVTTEIETTEEEKEARRLQDYEQFMEKHRKTKSDVDLNDVADEEFHKYASQVEEDVIFEKFKARTALDPEQVLRFDRNRCPLWITHKNILDSKDVPNCNLCNTKRIFEFQIMPQLLNSLNNPNIDWGIIAVYTCANSCDTCGEYSTEFVYKQDISNDD